ncbi:MAG: glycosyltransferase family 2 protein [Rhodobacteraceae bacterium]|nr:MAG: glycosyltransferase family 2 protein [Paracoccaceae bacterium]
MTQSWAVVMTAKEPAQLVLANVGWHLGTGASEVHVYLDDPDDPVADLLAGVPGAIVTRCDKAHWRATAPSKRRPESHRRRQGLNAEQAMVRARADWLVHLDADEFLWQDRPLGEEMAVVRELDCELHFAVHERLFARGAPVPSIFSGLFRTSTKALNRRSDGVDNNAVIFGPLAPVLNNGVLAHSAGKHAAPTGSDFRPGLHWAYRGKGQDRAQRYHATSTRLLHFDGLTRLHWLSKLIRYRDVNPELIKLPPHRLAQIGVYQDIAGDPVALAEYHRELREPDAVALARLRAFGLLFEPPFDPAPTIARVLGYLPDLTPETFDADLHTRLPHLP